MTKKRFERIYADVDVFCRDHNAKGISQLIEKEDYDKIVDLLNELHEENQKLHQVNNRCSDSHLRMRNRLERLHKDWDKLWDICKEQGMTDEEIIKEMDR